MVGDTFDVLAGDFSTGTVSFSCGEIRINRGTGFGEMLYAKEITCLEIASEESFKKTGGTIGWGLAGAAVFGPLGLLAGLVLGGKKKEVTFIMMFEDGRKLLGKADEKTFSKLRVMTFK